MSSEQIDMACDSVLSAPGRDLKVEFQGGDPLLRFDLIERAMHRLSSRATPRGKVISFVIASTIHQLTPEMCQVLKRYGAVLSTSIDGPRELHNKNRPMPGRNSYERTVRGVELARSMLGRNSVAALMTTTRDSLSYPEEIVDQYVELDLRDISIRPLSPFGFAGKRRDLLGASLEEYASFYERAYRRILSWNRRGKVIREGQAAIVLNKLLSPIDSGYVDLQAEPGAGNAAIVYNYDGYVYPSDEARMLAETGDISLRLGPIGEPLESLLASSPMQEIAKYGTSATNAECMTCAYGRFCAPNPIMAKAEFGAMDVKPSATSHCSRTMWLFDFFLLELASTDAATKSLLRRWARVPQ